MVCQIRQMSDAFVFTVVLSRLYVRLLGAFKASAASLVQLRWSWSRETLSGFHHDVRHLSGRLIAFSQEISYPFGGQPALILDSRMVLKCPKECRWLKPQSVPISVLRVIVPYLVMMWHFLEKWD